MVCETSFYTYVCTGAQPSESAFVAVIFAGAVFDKISMLSLSLSRFLRLLNIWKCVETAHDTGAPA